MNPPNDLALVLPADVEAALPAAGGLPLPTAEELQLTLKAAAEVLADVQGRALPSTTERALKSVLRYWSRWHLAVYGTKLPLVCDPPAPVPGEAVLVFIAHHTPVIDTTVTPPRIRTGMPPHVRERLTRMEEDLEIKVAGRRQVAKRAARVTQVHGDQLPVDDDVPALKTLQQRVSLLGTLHTLKGLTPPQDSDGRIRPWMVAVGKAVQNTVQVALPQSKQPIEADEFQGLLAACGSGSLTGKRDQALLLATYSSGRRRSEVARMRLEHLRPGQMLLPGGQQVLGYWWDLYEMKGRRASHLGQPVLSVPLVGAAAEALDAWLDVLRRDGHTTGPVWRTLRRRRGRKPKTPRDPHDDETLGVAIEPKLVASIVKQRAGEALLHALPELQGDDPDVRAQRERLLADYADRLGAHSLRSGFATSQIKAGVSAFDVMKLTGHTSISSFRIYDHSGNEHNPAIAELMRFEL